MVTSRFSASIRYACSNEIATYDAASNQVAASDDSVFNLSFDDDQVDVYGINPVCLEE